MLDRGDVSAMLAKVKDLAPRGKRAQKEPATVLIVDDEEPVRCFVNRVLSDAGLRTTLAASGPEAIEACTKARFDLLVTDLMMPEMNGDELGRRLRQADPELKVLYLTGFSDRLFKEKVVLWDGEAFLDKPCSLKGLREAVSLLLYGRLDMVTRSA